ncbi:DUF4314 domain-containing protein [Halobacillus locisalis]|uniref:DUF4314 domain-containing protein n=1 Tax=Halobacillus locisalis TaxID=220753 RepID=A0A838CXQ6_9BACI|nr:DUF4314 domain-containing protein [Halobacillus locisalis]MBA2176817.1 DUF4314 domain-containing protein [Halobacillus locisalis]
MGEPVMLSEVNVEYIEALKLEYPIGVEVQLVKADYKRSSLKTGLLGEVKYVDQLGTIYVLWGNGEISGLMYGKDDFFVTNQTVAGVK